MYSSDEDEDLKAFIVKYKEAKKKNKEQLKKDEAKVKEKRDKLEEEKKRLMQNIQVNDTMNAELGAKINSKQEQIA